MKDPVRVLVVDDEAPARAALRRMLSEDPEVEVVGCCADGKQASRSAPDHTASKMKKRSKGGAIQTMAAMQMMVSAILTGDENRLARIQPSMPVLATGAGNNWAGASRR